MICLFRTVLPLDEVGLLQCIWIDHWFLGIISQKPRYITCYHFFLAKVWYVSVQTFSQDSYWSIVRILGAIFTHTFCIFKYMVFCIEASILLFYNHNSYLFIYILFKDSSFLSFVIVKKKFINKQMHKV